MGEVFEDVVRELLLLARRKPLRGRDLARAKELMVRLREMGFTNAEVSELTNGGWSEPTIKVYTRGTTVRDSSLKEGVLRTLSRMISMGLNIKDIEAAISIKADLDARGLALEDVLNFLEEVKKSKVELKQLLQTYKTLRSSGLQISQLPEVLLYKSKLEGLGLTIDGLREVYRVSEAFGGFNGLIKAVDTYGTLQAMEAEVRKLSSDREVLEKQVSELREEVRRLKEEKAGIEGYLKLYEELKSLGFDKEVLKELKDTSSKYGSVKEVIEAVNTYGSLAKLKSEVERVEKEKSSLEAELRRVEADYAHLQAVIKVCENLLYKLKFSVPAIVEVYEIAKRYGEPTEVFKAIGRYGELKAIEEEVEKLTAKRRELELRVKELSSRVQELRGLVEELRGEVKELFKPLVKDLEKSVELLGRKFSEAVDSISSKYEEYAKKFGELMAEVGKLEEELRVARIVQSLIKYPSEGGRIPLDYDILMVRAVMNHCRVRGVNPKVRITETIARKYGSYTIKEVELLDLLELVLVGLESSLTQGSRA